MKQVFCHSGAVPRAPHDRTRPAPTALLARLGLALGRGPRTPSLEACLAEAGRAIAEDAWPTAARWLAEARRFAPRSGRLCADLGYALAQLGRHDEALHLFEEARSLGWDEAEALFQAALTAAEAGRPPAEVECWLVAALAEGPTLVTDVDHPVLALVRGRWAVEDAIDRAWRRVRDVGFVDAG